MVARGEPPKVHKKEARQMYKSVNYLLPYTIIEHDVLRETTDWRG